MPRTLEVAIREAVGKRGVSVVVISGDVALQPRRVKILKRPESRCCAGSA